MDDKYNAVLNVLLYINMYYKPILLCVFLLGNSLSVYVLLCTKLRYNSSSIYLGALAISDNAVLMTVFINWLMEINIIKFKYWLRLFNSDMQILFIFLSVWIVVVFTVQRYIVIKWPLLSHSVCTVNRTKIVLIGLTLLGVLYSILWSVIIIYLEYEMEFTVDKKTLTFWWRVLYSINFIVLFVLPATIIVTFNILIIYIIVKQNRTRGNLIFNSATSNDKTLNSDNKTSHIKATKMLVIISSIFIILNAPIQVLGFCISYNVRINIYC